MSPLTKISILLFALLAAGILSAFIYDVLDMRRRHQNATNWNTSPSIHKSIQKPIHESIQEFQYLYIHTDGCDNPAFRIKSPLDHGKAVPVTYFQHLDGSPLKPDEYNVCGSCGEYIAFLDQNSIISIQEYYA